MGLRDWRTRHSMRDPVRGQFRVTGSYYLPSTPIREKLTGVVTGPGIPPTAGEHLDDKSGRWFKDAELPVMVDRSDPTRFVILWDEVAAKPDYRADARRQATQAAEQMRSGGTAASARPPEAVPANSLVPDWAREMIASLADDVAPDGSSVSPPVIIDGGTQVIDLTAGQLSAADAERLSAVGEPATAVLTGITQVPVPQAALPGPTASLCDLSLEVTRSDGRTYSASTRLGFRNAQRRAAITAPGIVLPVRIDPTDQACVAVDIEAFNAQHPGS